MTRREHAMMELKEQTPRAACVIQSYGPDGFRIGNNRFAGPVLVAPDRVTAWSVTSVEFFSLDDFGPLFELSEGIDLILLGGGQRAIFPSREIRAQFDSRNMAVESMDTGAAVRTFNLLLAEERRVAAALLPIP